MSRASFRTWSRCLLALVANWGLLAVAAPAGEVKKTPRTFLWKATSVTNTVYLFGSVHVGAKDFFPLPAEVENAFDRSKTLVVELKQDIKDDPDLAKLIKEKGFYPKGQSLSKSVSKKTLEMLKAYAEKKGLSIEKIDNMRPWAIALLLPILELKDGGFVPEQGIEQYVEGRAKKAKMPILALETAEIQFQAMSDYPPDLQERLLSKSLAEMPQIKKQMEKLIAAWKSGDGKALEDLLLSDRKDPDSKALYERIFDERNVKMVEKIEGYLKEREPCFVVVGAGHLVGEQGVVRLLEKKKYKVERMLPEGP